MHFKSALLIAAAVLFSFHSLAWGEGDIALVNTATDRNNIQETQQAATDPEPETAAGMAPVAPDTIPSETDL
ncbi:MAG: hypothetical protein ACRET9_05295, partial [Burkholderiales bacterium]